MKRLFSGRAVTTLHQCISQSRVLCVPSSLSHLESMSGRNRPSFGPYGRACRGRIPQIGRQRRFASSPGEDNTGTTNPDSAAESSEWKIQPAPAAPDDTSVANTFRNGLAVVGTIGAGKDATVRFNACKQYRIKMVFICFVRD